jgi:uncharacterized SAM-binding protein YcdF (DUF218 family)
MFLLKKTLTALILPPLGPLLLAFFGLWLTQRHPRIGRWLIGAGLVSLTLFSTPWTANFLMAGLIDTPPISTQDLARAQAIVTLGGGNYHGAIEYGGETVSDIELERLRYTARLAKASGLPVAISGGTSRSGGEAESITMRTALATDFGVATRWVETTSVDTIQNAANLAPILKQAGIQRIALVTHVWHMPRARKLFEQQGFEVLPAPTGFTSAGPEAGIVDAWLPNADALFSTQIALHEWLGLLYSRLVGVSTPPQ